MAIEGGERKNSCDIEKHKAENPKFISALLCIRNHKRMFRSLTHNSERGSSFRGNQKNKQIPQFFSTCVPTLKEGDFRAESLAFALTRFN